MNSVTSEKFPIIENKPTPNIHTQMTLENLRMDPSNQFLVPFNSNLHEAIRFQYARFTRRSKGLKTKPVETKQCFMTRQSRFVDSISVSLRAFIQFVKKEPKCLPKPPPPGLKFSSWMKKQTVNRTWTQLVGEDQRSSLLRAWFAWGLVQFILVQDLRF